MFIRQLQYIQRFFFNILKNAFSFIQKNPLLFFFFIIGLLIRILGTNPGYPQIHDDEPSLQEATRILVLYHKYDPQNYYYGSLLPIVYAFFIVIFYIPLFFIQLSIKDFHIYNERGIFGFVDYFFTRVEEGGTYFDTFYNIFPYWTRYETAILSSFTIIVTYLLVKRLFNKPVGLIAAFLIAVNYRHSLSSMLTLADAPTALFAVLSVYLSIRLLESSNLKNYIYAGLGIGCALSVKYFIYILPAFAICHSFATWNTSKKNFFITSKKLLFNKGLWIAIILASVIFVLINPYLFINHTEAQRQMNINALRYGLDFDTIKAKLQNPINNLIPVNWRYPFGYFYVYGLGKVLSITILIAFFYCCIAYRFKTFILSSVIFTYLFVFVLLSGNTPVRNYGSIMPLILIFPSIFIYDFVKIFFHRKKFLIFLVILVCIVSFESLRNSYLTSLYFSSPSNIAKGIEWINNNIPVNSLIAKTNRVYVQKEHKGISIQTYTTGLNTSIQELQLLKPDYVIINSNETATANMLNWIKNIEVMNNTLFSEENKWDYINNSYISLTMNELSIYKIAQFSKPYWQSLEPAYFIFKIPNTDTITYKKEREINFDNVLDNKNWKTTTIPFTKNEGSFSFKNNNEDNSQVLFISDNDCKEQMKISSNKFNVQENYWLKVEAYGKRNAIGAPHNDSNGFIRIDYYSSSNKLLYSSVSKALHENDGWEKLTSESITPLNSKTATVSFQIDSCYNNQSFAFNNITIYKSLKEQNVVDIKKVNTLPKNFFWVPEIM